MSQIPDKAFILAAGMGTRLRPHTDTMPKPMVPVAGRPILDYALDKLAAIGVKDVWINLHYLPDVIRSHLSTRNDVKIRFSEEKTLLNTGGGVKKCLKEIGSEPFFMINGDALWKNTKKEALLQLSEAYAPEKTDILLLLQSVSAMTLTGGVGDYNGDGINAARALDKKGQYMFTGLRIVHPRVFDYPQANPDIFSFLDLMDEAEKQGRLQYVVHDGDWHHISTPADLAAVDAAFRSRA